MLKSSDLFHLAFYQKSPFTGSMDGMRYRIEKADQDDTAVLKVWIFPGPFCFDKTADDLKESKTFDLAEESLPLIADWLNKQYEARAGYWNKHKNLS